VRLRRRADGALALEARTEDEPRGDLHAGDVILAADGVPLDPTVPAYLTVQSLLTLGPSMSLTILRDGVAQELPPLESLRSHEPRPYASLRPLEAALAD
jgi:S1-C subfamily serine protease